MNFDWHNIENRRNKHRGMWWWTWFHPEKLESSHLCFNEFFENTVKKDNVPNDKFSEWDHCTSYGGIEPVFGDDGWREGEFAVDTVQYALKNMDQGRHYRVLKALVADRDSSVLCCELPVWGRLKDDGGMVELTGHIDAIEFFDGKLYILDFKPETSNPHRHVCQVEGYRKMLAKRLGIDCEEIGLGIFNKRKIWRRRFEG